RELRGLQSPQRHEVVRRKSAPFACRSLPAITVRQPVRRSPQWSISTRGWSHCLQRLDGITKIPHTLAVSTAVAARVRLHIEVEHDSIIVTLPGTTFHVIYRKSNGAPGLVRFALQADKSAGISQANFLARARRVANDKARELGWIV